MVVAISATPLEDIGPNMLFTITFSAIAILSEVEYWRSLTLDFGRQPGFQAPDCAAQGLQAGIEPPAAPPTM
jgi:hypothetical protein